MIRFIFLILLISSFLILACESDHSHQDENVWYTCSMDPQVMEKKPGMCPICKMELTKIIVDPKQKDNSITLSASQIELANIRLDTVLFNETGSRILWRGIVSENKNSTQIITARAPGRVDKLVFKEAGSKVSKGDVLYYLYSEELNAAIEEYLLAKEKAATLENGAVNYDKLAISAKEKLKVWGLEEGQLRHLSGHKKLIPFFSPKSGTIAGIRIREGEYVQTGTELYSIEDYTKVWIEAEVFPEELKYARNEKSAEVVVEGVSGAFPGKIDFISPVIDPATRLIKVRIVIENTTGLIKPGMLASVGRGTAKGRHLSVKSESVLIEENHKMVWVKKPDENVFYPVAVKTGTSGNGFTEITKGLERGAVYVASGAYLLNSEYKLRHSGGMEGHQH